MFPGTPQERTLPTRWCASLQEMTKNFLNGACTLQCEAVPLLKAAMSPGPGVDRLPAAKFDVRRAFEDVERIAGREVTVEVTRARASLGVPDPRGDAATATYSSRSQWTMPSSAPSSMKGTNSAVTIFEMANNLAVSTGAST
jgi:hypothetical protein